VTAGPQTTATTTVPASVRARLLAVLDRIATLPGNRVVRVEAVHSTHIKAVRYMSGEVVFDDGPVWVVQAEGYFSCSWCYSTSRAFPPPGRALSLIVRDSGTVPPDLGLDPTPKDLSQLGPVVRLRG